MYVHKYLYVCIYTTRPLAKSMDVISSVIPSKAWQTARGRGLEAHLVSQITAHILFDFGFTMQLAFVTVHFVC